MFKKIHSILTSLEGSIKIPVHRCLTLDIYNALIEYENGKAKSANYRIQIDDCDYLND